MIKRSMAADRNVGLAHPQAPHHARDWSVMSTPALSDPAVLRVPPLLRHFHTDEFRRAGVVARATAVRWLASPGLPR